VTKCAACGKQSNTSDYDGLAAHFIEQAEKSYPVHVMWLNKYITKEKMDASNLAGKMKACFSLEGITLKQWIKKRFIERFYGAKPHPFVLALQHPSRVTLLGYVIEHQHFLEQWVHSCAYIMAKTDR
jgi:pyrroloquinoline-quinone synthase